jgi:hypothetical protein
MDCIGERHLTGITALLVGQFGGSSVNIDSVNVIEIGSSPATALYELQSNGQIVYTNQFGTEFWVNPPSAAADYEVRATLISGDTPTGTLNTWLNLGTTRTWLLMAASTALRCSLTIEIRRSGGTTVLDSAQIDLDVEGL